MMFWPHPPTHPPHLTSPQPNHLSRSALLLSAHVRVADGPHHDLATPASAESPNERTIHVNGCTCRWVEGVLR